MAIGPHSALLRRLGSPSLGSHGSFVGQHRCKPVALSGCSGSFPKDFLHASGRDPHLLQRIRNMGPCFSSRPQWYYHGCRRILNEDPMLGDHLIYIGSFRGKSMHCAPLATFSCRPAQNVERLSLQAFALLGDGRFSVCAA